MGSLIETLGDIKHQSKMQPFICLVFLLGITPVFPLCSDLDTVDAGGGPGSCLDNCDCPDCAPYCSTWGYCQASASSGSSPASCEVLAFDGTLAYNPGYTSNIRSKKKCPCGGGGRCGRKCCQCWT